MTDLLLSSAGWVLDVIFFLVIILGTVWGAYRGFLVGLSKLAGKISSIICAVLFCVAFSNFLELCFHMTTGITTGIANSIAKNELYAVGISSATSGSQIGDVLKSMGIPALPRWFIKWSFADVELIPSGTTAATLIGSVLAKWISIIISFVLLLVLIRVGAFFLAKALKKVVDKFAPTRTIDQLLGALLGFAKAFFVVSLVIMFFNWLPITGVRNMIISSHVVGPIARSEWFRNMTSYAISGKWFTNYLSKLS